MAKEIYRVEKAFKEQQEAVKKTVESNIKAKEEEDNKANYKIDEECNRKVETYQAQILMAPIRGQRRIGENNRKMKSEKYIYKK